MPSIENKGALYFVTEQACCLAQAQGRETDDFRACQAAAEYLAGGDAETMAAFTERTGTIKRDPDADYDTEQYEGKRKDVGEAVSALNVLGTAEDTPEQVKGLLLKVADIIAAFYDMENVVTAIPA